MIGSKRVKRQIESTLQAFEVCMGQIRKLEKKYNFTEEEKLTFYKFEYQVRNLSKELSEDLN